MSKKTEIGIGHLIRAMQQHGFGHEEIMAMREALISGNFKKINFCEDAYYQKNGRDISNAK